MSGHGSTGNVIAGLASFFCPGLGQLVQGRIFKAFLHFCLAGILWMISFGTLGWVMHLWSAFEAARYTPYD
jgi:TM2 domain-containing membrane protein YozV